MPSTENGAGTMSQVPAVVLGTTAQQCFRELLSAKPDESGRTVAAVLGQLAVVDAAACDKIVLGACTAGRLRRSLVGIESVLLSALLGSTGSRRVADAVAEVWDRADVTRTRDGSPVPVLDPVTGELAFLSTSDLRGLDLRTRVGELTATADPGTGEALAMEILTAATAVASLAQVAALPADHELKRAALALLGDRPEAPNLVRQIVTGVAALVDVALSDEENPRWPRATLCLSAPVSGPGLAGQVVRRGDVLMLQSLPRIDARGAVVSFGFMPNLLPPPQEQWSGVDRRARDRRERLRTGLDDLGRVDDLPWKIIYYGPGTDPLTGAPTNPETGQVIGPPPGLEYAVARMRDALRAKDLSTGSTVEEVLDWVVQVDYGLRTLWE